jgi:hypothetical protein
MINSTISVSIKGNPNLDKQSTFALASSLTMVAKEAQVVVRDAIESNFTIRTSWDRTGPFSVKIQPATKQDLVAVIGTAADWLEKFLREDQGAIVINHPRGQFLAVPTSAVRRTKRQIVRALDRPRNLRGKGDIVLPLKKGGGFVLLQRVGPRARLDARNPRYPKSRLVALYVLTPAAKIRQKDVLAGPVIKVFEKRFADILEQQLKKAFATAK